MHRSSDRSKPDRVVWCAATYFKKVYVRHNFLDLDPRKLAPTCLYLACKAEECQVQAKLLLQFVSSIAGGESSARPAQVKQPATRS